MAHGLKVGGVGTPAFVSPAANQPVKQLRITEAVPESENPQRKQGGAQGLLDPPGNHGQGYCRARVAVKKPGWVGLRSIGSSRSEALPDRLEKALGVFGAARGIEAEIPITNGSYRENGCDLKEKQSEMVHGPSFLDEVGEDGEGRCSGGGAKPIR